MEKRRQSGLTLVELMVTLAVAITLLAIGIPAFQGIEANSRAAAQANALVTALTLARSEAVGRATPMTVCAAASATACAADSTGWVGGWLVFSDFDQDASTLAADEIVKVFDRPRGNPVITVTPARAFLRFNTRGENAAGEAVAIRLEQTGTTSSQDRCIRVAASGQITTTRVEDSGTCP